MGKCPRRGDEGAPQQMLGGTKSGRQFIEDTFK